MPTSVPPEPHPSGIDNNNQGPEITTPNPTPAPPPTTTPSTHSHGFAATPQPHFYNSNFTPRRTSVSLASSHQNSLERQPSERDQEEDAFVLLLQAFEAFVIGAFAGVLINLLALFFVKERIWRGVRGFGRDLCEVGGAWPFVIGVVFGGVLQAAIAAFILVSLLRD